MSAKCPQCGNNRTISEREDGVFWCSNCKIPLYLTCVKGGCILTTDPQMD